MMPPTLLWTGGWDSSFRLLQTLLVERRPVRPAYVIDPDRGGTTQEIRTMELMRREVLERLDDPSLLAPTQVFVRTHFTPTPAQVEAYRWVAERTRVGQQYLWLAAVAEALGWEDVEICMQAHDEGPTELHDLVFADDRGAPAATLGAELFRHWSYPVLATTKGEMAAVAREHGFYDLLVQRWFCHTPLGGRPCGTCRPCQLADPKDGVRFANPVLARGRLVWRGRRHGVREMARRAAGQASWTAS